MFVGLYIIGYVLISTKPNIPPKEAEYGKIFNMPFLGEQKIFVKQSDIGIGEVSLKGIINEDAKIEFNKINDTHLEINLDKTLKEILKKWKCTLKDVYYDSELDLAYFNVDSAIPFLSKKLILKRIN